MSIIWGPALDAEIEYRRTSLAAAAVRRRRARGRPATRTPRDRAVRVHRVAEAGTPLVAGFSAVAASPRR
jgi:hypothetical protein